MTARSSRVDSTLEAVTMLPLLRVPPLWIVSMPVPVRPTLSNKAVAPAVPTKLIDCQRWRLISERVAASTSRPQRPPRQT